MRYDFFLFDRNEMECYFPFIDSTNQRFDECKIKYSISLQLILNMNARRHNEQMEGKERNRVCDTVLNGKQRIY